MGTLSFFPRSKAGRRTARVRPAVEPLEERAVPSAFPVTTLNDAGGGSLRQAILNANAAAGDDTITFQPGLSGTITLTTGELPVTGSVTILGPGADALAVSGNNASRIFAVKRTAGIPIDVAISGLTLTRGQSGEFDGGAIDVAGEVLALSGVVITGSTAQNGGGISLGPGGRLTLDNCTVSGNHADRLLTPLGGGLSLNVNSVTVIRNSTISGNKAIAGSGGGVFVRSDGSLTVENSTVSGNSAGVDGGGIDVDAATLVVRNSTVSGNSARFDGGGIWVGRATAEILNSTVAFNRAAGDNAGGGQGGGVFARPDASVTLRSTLVGDNAVGATGAGPDVSGPVTATNSLVENTAGTTFAAGSAGNILGLDPLLGPLQFNGGPTQTHALLPGSPALEHGANPAGLTTDQRGVGFPRVLGAAADIGAFEGTPPPQIVAVAFRQRGVAR